MFVNRKKGVVKIKGKIFNRARKNCEFGMEGMLENSMISFCPYKYFKLKYMIHVPLPKLF